MNIQHAAERLAEHLRVKEFKCSAGWLWWFSMCHGRVNHAISGEILSADVDAITPFVDQLLQLWEEEHLHEFQIYKTNETVLNRHISPQSTICLFLSNFSEWSVN